MPTPEDQARETIDGLLTQAGWVIQDSNQVNLSASRGVVIRNFPLEKGHGFADYLFYIDGKAAGVIEAKREGKQTTNLASLNLTKLSAFPIPQPSASEQNEIVAEAERRFSFIEELETTVEANLIRAAHLRQSVLTKAFSGELVAVL